MAFLSLEKTSFAQATAVKQLSSHTYGAVFPDDWCIGSVPHGGFVTSCFLQVASAHFSSTLSAQNQPHTITLHLDFLRRTQTGPALFRVQDTKVGRQTSVIHVSLSQGTSDSIAAPFSFTNPREEVVGYITNSNMTNEKGATLSTGYSLSPPVPPVSLSQLRQNEDKLWARQDAMPFAVFRKATQKVNFHFPRKGQAMRSLADEWLWFANGEKFTNASLGYISDMFPMPVEAFADPNPYDISPTTSKKDAAIRTAKYWYPTLLLNLDIKKALPEEGVEWIFARVRAKKIKNGRMDLEIIIMDAEGDIVALSHHVCLVLGAERNLAKRRLDSSKI